MTWRVLRDEGCCASQYPAHRPQLPSCKAQAAGSGWTQGSEHAPDADLLPACLSHPCNCLVQLGVGWELIALLHH